MSEFTAKVYNKFDSALECYWRELERESENYVFQCYDWLHHWQNVIGNNKGHSPVIVVIFQKEKVIGLFPFSMSYSLGAKILGFLGGEQADYNSPIIHSDFCDKKIFMTIWDVVKKALPVHDIIIFNRIPGKFEKILNPINMVLATKKVATANFAILPSTIEEQQTKIPKKVRADSRRQNKRLLEYGELSMMLASSDDEYKRLISPMINQKRKRYISSGVRDIFSDPDVQKFYRSIEIELGISGRVHLTGLLLGDQVLATHWGAVYKKRFYLLMPTYSYEWNKFSPGRLLLERLMDWAINYEVKIFDFTIGSEEYKKNYCNAEMEIFEYTKLVSPFGLLVLLHHHLLYWLKNNPRSRKLLTSMIVKYRRFKGHAL